QIWCGSAAPWIDDLEKLPGSKAGEPLPARYAEVPTAFSTQPMILRLPSGCGSSV
ncbi:MAG: hypothetical protein JWR49_3416, partial [Tardiphaga sp.]|nr:hypothetical protein [Tardiphaga sp.]